MTSVKQEIRFILLSVILSFTMAVILAEVFLGVKENYARKSVMDYADTKRFQPLGWGGFLKENLNIYVTDGLGGKVRWRTNSQGFRSDREFTPNPAPGVMRILALGDSFNAGFRVDQNATLPYWQNDWINRHFGPAEILVAETEEPATALYYLARYGMQLKPQIVLLGITLGNDIVQAYQGLDAHGGYILSTENGIVQIKENKNFQIGFEKLAAYKIPSEYLKAETPTEKFMRRAARWITRRRLLRWFYQQHEAITSWGDRNHLSLFDPNNGFGVFTDPLPLEMEEAYRRLFRVLEAFALTCHQQGTLFAVQLFPQRYQVQAEDWARAKEEYGLNPTKFNLMGPNQKIGNFCRKHGIIFIDPTAAMANWYAKTKQPLYLPRGDMHWNKEGHYAFFECSLPALKELAQAGFRMVEATNTHYLAKGKASGVNQ